MIGAIATVIGVAVPYFEKRRIEITETPTSVTTSSPEPSPSPSPPPPETVAPPVEPADEPPPHDQSALPLEFTLRDGDQRTFLGDQASVAAEFNQIGSEEFVTLKVGTMEGEPVPHAVLGAGARYPFRLAGKSYSVYVLSVDKTARTVGVRINRSSESQ